MGNMSDQIITVRCAFFLAAAGGRLADANCAYKPVILQHRYYEQSARARCWMTFDITPFGRQVGNLNDLF
jgi:hypothetical protein